MRSVWYPIDRCWSGEGGCRVADGPDRRCCPACVASPEAAVREVQVALQAWLASACEHGDPIPEPRYPTAIYTVQAPA